MARPKSNGPWAPLSATYYQDDAILEAGERAELLFVRGLAYCGEAMSDGFISDRQLKMVVGIGMRDATKRAQKLCDVGVWCRVDGGYVIRSWLKWNKSADEIGRHRKRDRERKAAGPAETPDDPDGIPVNSETDSAWIPDGIQQDSTPHITSQHITTPHDTSPQVPATPGDVASADPAPTAQTLIAEWIDNCGDRPPSKVIGQVAKEVGAMLSEGISYEDVRNGLAAWHHKGLHPSTLASVVHEHRTRDQRRSTPTQQAPKESTTDARVREAIALAAKFAEADSGNPNQPALPYRETA